MKCAQELQGVEYLPALLAPAHFPQEAFNDLVPSGSIPNAQAGMGLVTGDKVSGNVTLHLKNVTFDEAVNEDDTAMEKNGVTLLIDPMSYQYLVGAEIDYTEGLEGAQFVIKNPNATSTCGCGSSFSP